MSQNDKRWMVGLDLSDTDQTIIKWVKQLSDTLKPEKIYFLHAEESFEPESLPESLSDEMLPADENQKVQLTKSVNKEFEDTAVEWVVEVVEGKPFDQLLHWIKIKNIDLFIAGRKNKESGSGILPHKLSRQISCDLLLIPEINLKPVQRILVPIDFSEHSKLALEQAIEIGQRSDYEKVICYHIYSVPSGYYKTGKSHEQMAKIMKEHAKKRFDKFVAQYSNIQIDYESSLSEVNRAKQIRDMAIQQKCEMVILGSKGQSVGSLILLGSTTERFLQLDNSFLTMVIKKPGEHLGFFEAFMKV
ncbi:universal stress protein [Fulvivirga sp. RKSG066]|uniref:universal stress protein n=1 Tax=Fulvivirga aurantia TaxID=2529383 RepID=UPI0012BB80FE|nr:universal stress protein [Fulvivirga aurantia]MTI22207.1 universal stress protein [Fulvivirga aurantia]